MPEPQQRAQRRRQPLHGLGRQPQRPGGQERRDITSAQIPQPSLAACRVSSHERPDRVQIATSDLHPEATLGQQPAAIAVNQLVRPRLRRGNLRPRSHAQPAQVAQQGRQRLRCQIRAIPGRAPCRQIRLHHRSGQRRRAQASSCQPPAQVPSQPQLAPCRELREAQPGQLTGQPRCVRRERARHADPIQNIHVCCPLDVGENSLTWQDARLCRYRQPGHPRHQRRPPAYRHNGGVGVMLVMPISA